MRKRGALWSMFIVAVVHVLGGVAMAQCGPQWLSGGGIPGVNGSVSAMTMWDPDGPGPMEARLVIGGTFTFAGTVPAANVAMWNGQGWTALGAGLSSNIYDAIDTFAVLPDGSLVAGGSFQLTGALRGVARWDGSAWRAMGSGISGAVYALSFLPDGRLIAGGSFSVAYGGPADGVAVWDGAAWGSIALGIQGTVRAFATLRSGDLIAGGTFTSVGGGIGAVGVARLTPSGWRAVGSLQGGLIGAVAVLPNGDIAIGGAHIRNATTYFGSMALYTDDGDFHLMGDYLTPDNLGDVHSLLALPDGSLIAGGYFTGSGAMPLGHIARWDGSTWRGLVDGVADGDFPDVESLLVSPDGDLYAGGGFVTASGVGANGLARWDGSAWHAIGAGLGLNGTGGKPVLAPDGSVIITGGFTSAGGVPAKRVARWNGATWSSLGAGVGQSSVGPVAVMHSGDIVVGGSFSSAGGQACNNIARWDGVAWHPLGSGLSSFGGGWPYCLVVMSNGDLLAGGGFTSAGDATVNHAARWDGQQWSDIGAGLPTSSNNVVESLVVLSTGQLVASSGQAYRWSGAQWTPLSTGTSLFNHLLPNASGGMYAESDYTVGYLSQWNGFIWARVTPFAQDLNDVASPKLLYHGKLLATGGFTHSRDSTVPLNHIATWDGSSWTPFGSGLTGGYGAGASGVVQLPSGDLFVVGGFYNAGGTLAVNWAFWTEHPVPWIVEHPVQSSARAGATLILTSLPASGYTNVSYHWQRGGIDVADGPHGASPGGGTVYGALGVLNSPTIGMPAVLTIAGVQPSDRGDYAVVFSNQCGSATSNAAAVSIAFGCTADFDGDGVPGTDGDIASFFACLGGNCCATCGSIDFNGDGDVGTDADIDSFFRVLSGGSC